MRRAFVVLAGCWTASVPAPPPPPPPAPTHETLVEDAPFAANLSIDAQHLYWLGGEPGDTGIWRADKLPRAKPVRLVKTTDPRGLTLDGNRLWFADGASVRWVPTAGGATTTVVDKAASTVLDLTRDGGDIVVATQDLFTRDTKLTRYAADTGVEHGVVVVHGQGPIMLAQPEGVYVGTDAGLVRLARDGSEQRVSAANLDIQALAFEHDNVWFGAGGSVRRAPRTGGTDVEVATSMGLVTDVSTDERFVYWGVSLSRPPGSAIYRAPKAGGKPHTLARLDGAPSSVIVDGPFVYWCESESGRIVRHRRE